jgi:polar amino acid transport system substrate-binding protein
VTDPSVAPYTFYAEDNTTIIGGDPALAQAISEVLGVDAHFNATAFAGIIPAMKAGRYDISISSMGDTPLREKEINFVPYSTEGNALVVPQGNPLGIATLEDLCGKRIAVATGTIMESLATEQSDKCTDKIDVQVYPDQNEANLAVMSGRADATMNMASAAEYYVKTGVDQGLEVLLDNFYGRGYNAMGFSKDNTTLMMVVQQALQRLIDSGAYYKILDDWGMSGGYLDPPFVWINDGARFSQGQG